jgi:hypothetical protein
MDPLARLKLLRLFLFNDDLAFTPIDASFRINVPKDSVRKEIKVLMAASIIKKRTGKDGIVYGANKRFEHYKALQVFLRGTTSLDDSAMATTLKKGGNLRLIALSGLFTGAVETKIDLLIVGDRLEEKHLEKAVHEIEAELGRELRYAAFLTPDFRYRVGVYDRLIRDVFDYPHRTILDKIGM